MCLGIPGQIVEIEGADALRMAKVDFGGVRRRVSLAYVPEAALGDHVIVHVGFALSRIDEEEARRTRETLEQLAMQDELGPEATARGP